MVKSIILQSCYHNGLFRSMVAWFTYVDWLHLTLLLVIANSFFWGEKRLLPDFCKRCSVFFLLYIKVSRVFLLPVSWMTCGCHWGKYAMFMLSIFCPNIFQQSMITISLAISLHTFSAVNNKIVHTVCCLRIKGVVYKGPLKGKCQVLSLCWHSCITCITVCSHVCFMTSEGKMHGF